MFKDFEEQLEYDIHSHKSLVDPFYKGDLVINIQVDLTKAIANIVCLGDLRKELSPRLVKYKE